MSTFRITTDSAVDLSPERMEELGIPFVSLHLMLEEKDILDDMKMETSMYLYNRMRAGKVGVTSQATIESFLTMWEPMLQEGEDILYIGFSSALSGTINSGTIAREQLLQKYPERKIFIVDSLCASAGEGMLVEYAVQMKNEGMKLEALYNEVEETKQYLHHWFTVDDLAYLKRGGRVSGAAALFATLLSIKPVMRVDANGRLVPYTKVKGRRAAIKKLFEILCEKIDTVKAKIINISHADCLDDVNTLIGYVKSKFPHIPVHTYAVGAVIGAHAGPGTLALFFIGKEPVQA
ncbi:MAG: DegV family protein [Clostridiales bacterium]|nr:DegV family protein [Clostridiales bacterium]